MARAHAFFEANGIGRITRLVTDNGPAYRSTAFNDVVRFRGPPPVHAPHPRKRRHALILHASTPDGRWLGRSGYGTAPVLSDRGSGLFAFGKA
ncbi:hypothetical protein EHS14_10555 [Schaalia georgiae]|nr:hypothetical protein EHS14_10555 [Schaalia georgiae]